MADDSNFTTPTNVPDNGDAELKAMNAIVAALTPLTEEQRVRALEYVLRRFNAVALQTPPPPPPVGFPAPPAAPPGAHAPAHGAITDIRTLKEAKSPKSANEMAALVAYYVSELTPVGERRQEIGKGDIEKHFKAAGFKLPADAGFTLVNAKNAGYLDNAGQGQYKLNPVGYNLVVHRMGTGEDVKTEARRRRAPGTKRRNRNGKKAPRAKE